MLNNRTKLSQKLATGFGILLPFAETIRRFKQLTDLQYFLYWFDDYILGAFLLLAAWRAGKSAVGAPVYLAAAWGVAAGALFLSVLGQIDSLIHHVSDPAPVPSSIVLVVKLLFFGLCVLGIVLCFPTLNKEER